MYLNFIMKGKTEKIQGFDEMKHSTAMVSLRKLAKAPCIEVISTWNRFFNAYFGLNHEKQLTTFNHIL